MKAKSKSAQGALFYASGKKKSSIAKVWLQHSLSKKDELGCFTINDVDHSDYYSRKSLFANLISPIKALGLDVNAFVVKTCVLGGGLSSQSDAIKLSIAKALSQISEEYRFFLRKNGFLTCDARKVQPKKAGLRKARKREQFSKR